MDVAAAGLRILDDGTLRTLVFVRLAAAEAPPRVPEHPPAHLAVALDISSSMAGQPLAAALRALRELADRLGPRDRLGVVTFDRDARVLFAPRALDAVARTDLETALAAVRPGAGTNLYAGYADAAKLVVSAFVPGARPRVLLLTDGLPSSGPANTPVFEAAARELAARGVGTSAIGFGLHYDAELMAATAAAGDGAYHFVADPADLAAVLAEELRSSREVEATGAAVKVQPAADVGALELLHRYPTRAEPDGLVVEVGSVGRLMPRRLLFEVKGSPAGELARLRVSWRASAGEPVAGAVLPLSLGVEPGAELVDEARRELDRLELARAEDELWRLFGLRDRDGAGKALERAMAMAKRRNELGRAGAAETDETLARLADARLVLDGRLDHEAVERRSRAVTQGTLVSRLSRVPRGDDEP